MAMTGDVSISSPLQNRARLRISSVQRNWQEPSFKRVLKIGSYSNTNVLGMYMNKCCLFVRLFTDPLKHKRLFQYSSIWSDHPYHALEFSKLKRETLKVIGSILQNLVELSCYTNFFTDWKTSAWGRYIKCYRKDECNGGRSCQKHWSSLKGWRSCS